MCGPQTGCTRSRSRLGESTQGCHLLHQARPGLLGVAVTLVALGGRLLRLMVQLTVVVAL
jgi:hypothetical protein